MTSNDFEHGALFTNGAGGVYRIESWCMQPTCTLVNLETGHKEHFGIGGLTAESFIRLVPAAGKVVAKTEGGSR